MRWTRAWGAMVIGGGLLSAGTVWARDPGPPAEGAVPVVVPLTDGTSTSPGGAPTTPGGAPAAGSIPGPRKVNPGKPGGDPAKPAKPPSLLTAPDPGAPPAPETIWLTPDRKRGGYSWKGTGFRARISADGDLSFEDQRLGLKFIAPFTPRPNPYAVPSVESAVRGRRPKPAEIHEIVPRPEETLTGYETPYLADPREAARRGQGALDYGSNVPIAMVGATFDLTDELIRLDGQDPYRFDKARFAASTRGFRDKLVGQARRRAFKDACGRLRAELTNLAVAPPPDRGAFGQAVAALKSDLDASTEEGRLLRAYLDETSKAGHVDRAAVAGPWADDDPRLCGLVAWPAANAAHAAQLPKANGPAVAAPPAPAASSAPARR